MTPRGNPCLRTGRWLFGAARRHSAALVLALLMTVGPLALLLEPSELLKLLTLYFYALSPR
jgi:hypothetical protein